MKAVAYTHSLPISDPRALQDMDLPDPRLESPHDLLVRVRAISVNPVDAKVRLNRSPEPDHPVVLGWDAVGTVLEAGSQASGFKPGDRVFYAGDRNRAGSNSERQIVDARLVGHAPTSLSDAEAAALPLTSITAWELLFERLGVARDGGEGQSLLIVGAAGGVGSMLIQLARRLTRLKVIATASRPESARWVTELGAHAVIDHHQRLAPQLAALGITEVSMVASLTHTIEHFDDCVEALAPQGKLALIDDFPALDVMKMKAKSLSLHWESMFTRSHFQTTDMARQGEILDEIARLADSARLRTTLTRSQGSISAENLRHAHELIESGRSIGKLVLEGF
ncbi:zinc-binding alcohol dehydrogenase family protein [Niveibacterium terrae]|uniref:zinc-binding alcohol dehydrogenase family protein n=1 Tax=Niveibacterium terrae TaxID=3373598 RepID=UPI003A93B247